MFFRNFLLQTINICTSLGRSFLVSIHKMKLYFKYPHFYFFFLQKILILNSLFGSVSRFCYRLTTSRVCSVLTLKCVLEPLSFAYYFLFCFHVHAGAQYAQQFSVIICAFAFFMQFFSPVAHHFSLQSSVSAWDLLIQSSTLTLFQSLCTNHWIGFFFSNYTTFFFFFLCAYSFIHLNSDVTMKHYFYLWTVTKSAVQQPVSLLMNLHIFSRTTPAMCYGETLCKTNRAN